ncbi:hypothetical protein EXS66_01095 [Candidatus Saccharibacteria bacterium]|nr:hypothetical protein [Candidatus Saccharibacteria bacterium]
MEHDKREKRADQFFRRELRDSDVQKSAHYTFKDGFRLGFGFFIGFILGGLILILISSLANQLFKIF